jgi:hypothetical protein
VSFSLRLLSILVVLYAGTSLPASQRTTVQPKHLRVEGTQFVTSTGERFEWRGITAFRLLDFIADGDEARARDYLRWAAKHHITVVRVLAMMAGIFELSPAEGRRALPRLLTMAAEAGVFVEVVALAGTADISVDVDEHVNEIASIIARHGNAVLEVANEPVHPSQRPDVHNPAFLKRAAARAPKEVVTAFGSIERGEGFGDGAYITWHVPRETEPRGWGHVLAIAEGAAMVERWKKPVISDEPIGAAAKAIPGRRDSSPTRFRAAALLTRLAGLGATFHYEGGLNARIPTGQELACFNAWRQAWTLLPPGIEHRGTFRRAGAPGSVVTKYSVDAAAAVYERHASDEGWILAVGVSAEPRVQLVPGWRITASRRLEGVRIVTVRRQR